MKKCHYCGKEVEDHSVNGVRKWCNDSCRGKYKRKHLSLKRNTGINEGGEPMDLQKVDTMELLEEVSQRGFMSTRRDVLVDRHYKFPRKRKPFKLGLISDTHLGSTEQQITLLHEAYKEMAKMGIKTVLHAGDMTEGNGKQHKGQVYEMFLHGADAMVDYATKVYPREPGITTHIIGGSHDYSFYKEDGNDILAKIAEARSDIKYQGMFGTHLHFGNIDLYLMHGAGGVAYARSYKMQKIIEQFSPADKPNILVLGHYHVECYLPNYRNVIGIQMPCFQSQTNYLKAKGLSPELGFVVLEITPDAKGISHHVPDFHPYFNPVKGDY